MVRSLLLHLLLLLSLSASEVLSASKVELKLERENFLLAVNAAAATTYIRAHVIKSPQVFSPLSHAAAPYTGIFIAERKKALLP